MILRWFWLLTKCTFFISSLLLYFFQEPPSFLTAEASEEAMRFDLFKLWWQSFVMFDCFCQAWNSVRDILLERYGPNLSWSTTQGEAGKEGAREPGTPLNAWRHLDADGQNEVWLMCHVTFEFDCSTWLSTFSAPVKVSWAEFVAGCRLDEKSGLWIGFNKCARV